MSSKKILYLVKYDDFIETLHDNRKFLDLSEIPGRLKMTFVICTCPKSESVWNLQDRNDE